MRASRLFFFEKMALEFILIFAVFFVFLFNAVRAAMHIFSQ